MDPGTALGAVSLAFQIFASCIKGCQLLMEAVDLPEKYDYLRLRLSLEHLKLLDWWQASGFTEQDTYHDRPLDPKRQAMVDCLKQVQQLISDTTKIKERYGLVLKAADSQSATSHPKGSLALPAAEARSPISISTVARQEHWRQKALKFSNALKTTPSRLRWALFDATKFEQLLDQFAELNKALRYFLESAQKAENDQLLKDTLLHVLRLTNKVADLEQFVRSVHHLEERNSVQPHAPGNQPECNGINILEPLARLKALNISTEILIGTPLPRFDPSELQLATFTEDGWAGTHPQRTPGIYSSTAIWVEWKYHDASSTLPYTYVEDRISRLAILLRDDGKPGELRLPSALGTVSDPEAGRLGLVLTTFAPVDASPPATPQSLHTRMRSPEMKKPSLRIRVAMAHRLVTSLHYLHTCKWLHKGLRSDNVLFQGDTSDPRWLSFWLSGFDYSRPANRENATEPPSDHREHDLYRHPEVQFDVPRHGENGFNERHDIYSLGVVLMEIGIWQSIQQFLDIPWNQPIRRPVLKRVQSRLLDAQSQELISAEAGDKFAKVVHLCLVDETDELEDETGEGRHNSPTTLENALKILGSISV